MAKINRRPSAVRRSVTPIEEAAPQEFTGWSNFDIGEGDTFGPSSMGGPMGAPGPTFTPDPMPSSISGSSPSMGSGIGSPPASTVSPGLGGPPPSMGSPSIPAGAAGVKTSTMKMPGGGGYFSGGSTPSATPASTSKPKFGETGYATPWFSGGTPSELKSWARDSSLDPRILSSILSGSVRGPGVSHVGTPYYDPAGWVEFGGRSK
jgi:hypothetical protein